MKILGINLLVIIFSCIVYYDNYSCIYKNLVLISVEKWDYIPYVFAFPIVTKELLALISIL